MLADYHHLPKVLDMITALAPARVLEIGSGEGLYVPLIRAYHPRVSQLEVNDAKQAELVSKSFDVVLMQIEGANHQAKLEYLRQLLTKHRGVIAVAPKTSWDKADFAGIGPAMFVNDATVVIAYLGTTPDIKKLRHELLRTRVQRQLTGAVRDRRSR
jgi:hypothetical protein